MQYRNKFDMSVGRKVSLVLIYVQTKKKLNSVFIGHAYVESMTIELKKYIYRKHDVLMNRCLKRLRNIY